MNSHVYKKDEVVIGGTLAAAVYALENNATLLFTEPKKYFAFDKTKNKIFGHSRGTNKNEVLHCLIFELSLSGNVFLTDKIESIRVLPEKDLLKAFVENSRVVNISYSKLKIFDDKGLNGVKQSTERNISGYVVYDWFIARSGACHEYEEIIDNENNLAKKIYFYKSSRPFRKDRVLKDLVVESYLKKEELNDFDFSDTIVKIKTLKMMKEKGIKGKRNGRDSKNPEQYRYYAIKLELVKREFFAVESLGVEKVGNIIFDNHDLR